VLGDPDAAPTPRELGCDAAGLKPGVAEREGDDALFEVAADLLSASAGGAPGP
jgi:hypothetical protein